MDRLYRYEDILVSYGTDEFDDPLPPRLLVRLREYPVQKRTPKGAWIDLGLGDRRFVLLTARKRFACPTKKEAAESFRERKRVQINILKAQLRRAEQAYNIALSKYEQEKDS